MKKVRISSWEMDGHLFAAVEAAKAKRGSKWTWRRMQSEGLRLLLASWGEPVAMAEDSGDGCAHAPNVERVPPMEAHTHSPVPAAVVPAAVVPAAVVPAAVVPAAVVPAAVVPVPAPAPVAVELTEAEKRLAYAIKRRGDKQACLDAAYIEFASDPKSLRANNLIARMPKAIAEYDADIAAFTAEVEAERAAKENSGEVIEAGEV